MEVNRLSCVLYAHKKLIGMGFDIPLLPKEYTNDYILANEKKLIKQRAWLKYLNDNFIEEAEAKNGHVIAHSQGVGVCINKNQYVSVNHLGIEEIYPINGNYSFYRAK